MSSPLDMLKRKVLDSMLRSGSTGAGGGAEPAGQGADSSVLGSVFDAILGSIKRGGGLGQIQKDSEAGGLGDIFGSWISKGENRPIQADDVKVVLGSFSLEELAAKLGVDPRQLLGMASRMLPELIDKMTPNGKLEDIFQQGGGAGEAPAPSGQGPTSF